MTIDISNTQFHSNLAGIRLKDKVSFQFLIPAQTIPAFQSVTYSGSYAMDKDSDIGHVIVKYSGKDTFWRLVKGTMYASYGSPTTHQIISLTYYSGGRVYISTTVVDISGAGVTIPDITVMCRAFLYESPF